MGHKTAKIEWDITQNASVFSTSPPVHSLNWMQGTPRLSAKTVVKNKTKANNIHSALSSSPPLPLNDQDCSEAYLCGVDSGYLCIQVTWQMDLDALREKRLQFLNKQPLPEGKQSQCNPMTTSGAMDCQENSLVSEENKCNVNAALEIVSHVTGNGNMVGMGMTPSPELSETDIKAFATAFCLIQNSIIIKVNDLKQEVEASVSSRLDIGPVTIKKEFDAFRSWLQSQLSGIRSDLQLRSVVSSAAVLPMQLSVKEFGDGTQFASSSHGGEAPEVGHPGNIVEATRSALDAERKCGVCFNIIDRNAEMYIMASCGHYPYCFGCQKGLETTRLHAIAAKAANGVATHARCPYCGAKVDAIMAIRFLTVEDEVSQI